MGLIFCLCKKVEFRYISTGCGRSWVAKIGPRRIIPGNIQAKSVGWAKSSRWVAGSGGEETRARAIQEPFVRLGESAIEDIAIDPVCRDDIPAVLRGIQHLYCDEALRRQVFYLLDAHFLPGVDRGLGRPGMDLWRIFVLATRKQGIRCDDDRLQDLANCHETVREMLGHSGLDDHRRYEHRTLVRNVSLLTPELLNEINELVVKAGHALFAQEPEAPLRARTDSFVVETDVHDPTDVNLLWAAMRCLIRICRVGHWRARP